MKNKIMFTKAFLKFLQSKKKIIIYYISLFLNSKKSISEEISVNIIDNEIT